MRIERPSWDEYWFNMARVVSKRSTCINMRTGAILVRNNVYLSDGYMGAPRATSHCIALESCYMRETGKEEARDGYGKCRGVHAEMNAIINAARKGVSVEGGRMYIYRENIEDGKVIGKKPCRLCRSMMINAGLLEVIVLGGKGIERFDIQNWILEERRKHFSG